MSAKSVLEADGKAILNYHLTRAPPITKSTLPPPPHNPPPKLASLYFPEDASPEGVIQTAEATYPWLLAPGAKFVGKPDQLIKRRGKSGLLTLNKPWEEVKQWILERAGKKVIVDDKVPGFLRNFLVEPFVPHKQNEEYYVNIMSLREGDEILFTHEGGVDVGNVREKAKSIIIPVDLKEYPSNETLIAALLPDVPEFVHNVLIDFINRLYAVYVDSQFTYLEINPLVVIPNEDATSASIHFLDLAAKIDQTAEFECGAKWAIARSPAALGISQGASSGGVSIDAGPPLEFPAPFGREMSKEEAYIAALDAKTGASLKLTVLNSQGRIWTLVAGGGASVVYADAIMGALDLEERALKDAIKAEQNLPEDTPYDAIPLDDPQPPTLPTTASTLAPPQKHKPITTHVPRSI